MVVDHINHNVLDNRRSNLRICTPAQNQANTRPNTKGASKFKGVSRNKDKWTASIAATFDTEQEAADWYDRMARLAQGEFAYLNNKD